ncbi:isochorismatase family cysteine hydrolase [Metabacillus fastidiosus]|uniref:cysteine hydrolase family protein n=1 Tax=Metabacillus fastidiosus TaxID=1458 RepID=UPI002E1D2C19|nr:cysteine hydrolase [Metabacillus fastidiosus]
MSKKALINVDYTIDFVTGALPCGDPAIAIEEEISQLTEAFIKDGDFVVLAIDLHKENDELHPESKLFPPHNIEGTEGRNLYGKLEEVYRKYSGQENVYWMDKTRYSAFTGTNLEIKLREHGITELHLVGVCTDICVLHTAVDAYNKGFNIVVHSKAVASFNEAGHLWALEHFKHTLGATVV